MKNIKKSLTLLLVLTFFISQFVFLPAAIAKDELNLKAEGAILLDNETGQVLYEFNADKKWFPASTTKIMTLALALEAVEKGKVKLTDKVKASENACSYGGSQVYLDPRDDFSLEEMLIAIAVGSANDASVAVAEFLAGSEENFVKKMNQKAKEIGAMNTNFVNSHGLDNENHYTTPRDLALMGRYLASFEQVFKYTTIKHYTFRPEPRKLILDNTNKLLWRYPGTIGLKTGTTSIAKRNLVSIVAKDDLNLLGVVMGADEKGGHFNESIKLYNWAYSNYTFKKLYNKDQVIAKVNVGKGVKNEVSAVAADNVGALILKDAEKDVQSIKTKVVSPKVVNAPLKKGDKIGEIIVTNEGKELNRVALLANEDIAKTNLWGVFIKTIKDIIDF